MPAYEVETKSFEEFGDGLLAESVRDSAIVLRPSAGHDHVGIRVRPQQVAEQTLHGPRWKENVRGTRD